MRRSIILILLTAFTWCTAFGQSPPQQPVFEVATVKPAAPRNAGSAAGPRSTGTPPASSRADRSLITYTGATLKHLLVMAYNLRSNQVIGPSWLDSEKYDVIAKIPEGAAREQITLMLQALLLERFRMSVHWATNEAQVYTLVVGKSGPKLTKSQPDTKKASLSGSQGAWHSRGQVWQILPVRYPHFWIDPSST